MNGIVLSGNATQVTCDPNLCGTDSEGTAALPNKLNGLVLSGNANNNFIGSQNRSVIPTSAFSANGKAGIYITESAHDNVIFDCAIGLNTTCTDQLKNGTYSILIDSKAKENCIFSNFLDGNVLLEDCCCNNKFVLNSLGENRFGIPLPPPPDSHTEIINDSKCFNLIVDYPHYG
ncbi:MAG: hypothetical protein Barrevirus1_6 [Barrevirus sp.]|uniref:Uncharacterized protein n=1 Tax=Barrevirus sp. TaxID=2487763 RepID=A0A3G4ZR20_9VIRU|nr:MAG: hypothetical protein Barrevirus1_6 [Barrevirus sp.]